MDKILAPIKQRILQFIEYQQIVKKTFFEKIETNPSNFRSKGLLSEIGGDIIAKILSEYPLIDPIWLLTGKGSMVKTEDAPQQEGPVQNCDEILDRLQQSFKEIGKLEAKIELLKEENTDLKKELKSTSTIRTTAISKK